MSGSGDVVSRPLCRYIIPLMAVALAGACSESGTDQVASPTAPVTPASADACDLLSLQEAEKLVGGLVDEPKGGAPLSSDNVRLTDCTWMEMTSGRTVTIQLRHSDGVDRSSIETVANVRAELASAGRVDDVKGLADTAFWSANQLHAFRGGRDHLTVSVSGFPDTEAPSTARKAAEIALGRL